LKRKTNGFQGAELSLNTTQEKNGRPSRRREDATPQKKGFRIFTERKKDAGSSEAKGSDKRGKLSGESQRRRKGESKGLRTTEKDRSQRHSQL